MDALATLRQQHEQLRAALGELDVTVDTEERILLLAHVGLRLKAHAAVEDAVLYPILEDLSAGTRRLVAESRLAHLAVDALLDELLGTDRDAARLGALRQTIERHFGEEEENLFPHAERLEPPVRQALERAFTDYLDRYGDGAEDPLPAPAAE